MASGKAGGGPAVAPEMHRAAQEGGVKLQVKYDERQAFTSNHAYAGSREAPGGTAGQETRR